MSILQEELKSTSKDVELTRLKEMLSQKEATKEDTDMEERDRAAKDTDAPDPQPIKVDP